MNQKTVLRATAALLLALFAVAVLFHQRDRAAANLRLATQHGIHLIQPHSPRLGPDDAPVVIVEFFDPACVTCQAFHEPMKELLAQHPGKLQLVLRYAPFQVGAEHIVALLEAARLQDKFWPALDILMETQDAWKPRHEADFELAWQQLGGLGLDLDRLRRDMNDAEITRRINQDLEDAARLEVDSTPTFYVNGRPLPGFGFNVLKRAVEAALRQGGG
ncbi:MAG: thioredoxin domain-containing protein [Sulfuritalea sp.]|nr:thioredoxin domain-containing protein [Sulfuritalea sp.]